MNFNEAIYKIMPEVRGGGAEPFIIYRDSMGGWHGDFTRNKHGKSCEWIKDARENDSFSIEYTGKYFDNGSFSYVHDIVLSNRLRMEYYAIDSSGEESKKLFALINFIEDNIAVFSHTVTDYLATLEKPFAELAKMCPFNIATGFEGWTFNEGLAPDAIDRIEKAVTSRLCDNCNKAVPDNTGGKETPAKAKADRKPTLGEKLDTAKKKAAEQNSARNGERSKRIKHDERE